MILNNRNNGGKPSFETPWSCNSNIPMATTSTTCILFCANIHARYLRASGHKVLSRPADGRASRAGGTRHDLSIPKIHHSSFKSVSLGQLLSYVPIPCASGFGVGFGCLNTSSQFSWSTRVYYLLSFLRNRGTFFWAGTHSCLFLFCI